MNLRSEGTTGCHGDVTARPAWARDHGWSVPSWGDPATTPVLLAAHGWVLLSDDGSITPAEENAA